MLQNKLKFQGENKLEIFLLKLYGYTVGRETLFCFLTSVAIRVPHYIKPY